MKLGFIISLYDEIEVTKKNIKYFQKENCSIIVIQSEPKDTNKILKDRVTHFELLPDIAGSREEFKNSKAILDEDKTTTKPLSRNFNHAFLQAAKVDVDWWICILGDVEITNLNGIKKIIKKMEDSNKSLGFTRAVGQTFLDKNKEQTRIQKTDTHDFMPQFFIIKSKLVKKGIFTEIEVTNPYTFEQCMGDAATKFFEKNKLNFWQECYSICDYAYPKFIEGLKYNPDRAKLPRYVDGALNAFRRLKVR